MNIKKTNILVVGTGAIGSYYGGRLAQLIPQTATLCRSDYESVKENGIEVKSCKGDFHFTPLQVLKSASEYKLNPDFILVCLKVLPMIDPIKIIKDAVKPNTAIVLIQNGINIEQKMKEAFPSNEIISGIAFICVNRIAFGKVHHLDYGRLELGSYPDGVSNKTNILADFFNQTNVECKVSENIVRQRWQKLLWNVPFNSLSVIGGQIDTKEIMASESTIHLIRKIMNEILIVAEITGNKLDNGLIEKMIDSTKNMKPYKTSMLLDYQAKRSLEIDAILGNVIKTAKLHNITHPYIESLYSLLKLLAENNK